MPDDTPDRPSPHDELKPAFSDPSTEERIYSVLVGSTEPLRVADVVAEVGCSKDTARKYLDWFAELGVAVKHEGRPVRFERNAEYFEWRYVSRLADTHSMAQLGEQLGDLQERLETFRERYDADDPAQVDLQAAADARDEPLKAVWDDLTTWAGLEDEIRCHDRARQRLLDRRDQRDARAD